MTLGKHTCKLQLDLFGETYNRKAVILFLIYIFINSQIYSVKSTHVIISVLSILIIFINVVDALTVNHVFL